MSVARANRRKSQYIPLILVILVAVVAGGGPARAQPQPQESVEGKNVLVLNALESDIPVFLEINQGFSAALQAAGIGIRNQFYEHLELRRNPGPENRKLMVEVMRMRHGQRKIHSVVTIYPEALNFLLNEAHEIFPDVPVLALLLPEGYELPVTRRRIIPHFVIPDLKRTLEIALKLVPAAARVYVVAGSHPVDKWLGNRARQDFKPWEGRLDFRYLSGMPLEEILGTLSAAPSGSIVYITSFAREVNGKFQTTMEVARRIDRVSNAPVFGILDILLGNGIVGGSLIDFKEIGTKAGETVLHVLREARPAESIPTALKVSQVDTFDWRELKRWNLSESALPRGSVIVNREFSIWDLKYYTIGVLALILAQSFLISRLLVQRRRRRLAEESVWQKSQELNQFFDVTTDTFCV